MPRWIPALLVALPAALVARLLGLSPLLIFGLSGASLVPLAGLIGDATEQLAGHLGPRRGALLNVTFGNAAELIIALLAVRRGLLVLVKASITGSILANTLFALGLALLVGGLRHGTQHFEPRRTSRLAALMILAVAGLYLPATFAAGVQQPDVIRELSLLVGGILLATYLAYLVQVVLQPRRPESSGAVVAEAAAAKGTGQARRVPPRHAATAGWSTRLAALILAGSAAGAALAAELLLDALEPVTRALGLSQAFVGVVVVALLGNTAESLSAVRMAWQDRLDLALAISAGSGTQIALLVAPLLVLASHPLGHPMDVIFTPLELAILGLTTAIFAYISIDGETGWLEGVQLLGVYAIAALAFFFVPLQPA